MSDKITLSDLNKSALNQLPPFQEDDWFRAKENFSRWISQSVGTYYMLLSYDLRYFTMFKKDPCFGIEKKEYFFDILRECLENLGEVQSFEIAEDTGGIEIWVKNEQGENYIALLNWDEGLIKFYDYM